MKLEEVLEETAVKLLREAVTELPQEYTEAIREEMKTTRGEVGKAQLKNILDNIEIAQGESRPICQDTGIVAFIVELGDRFPLRSEIKDILVQATRRATEVIPLRPNAVDIFKGNTGDNVGLQGQVPIIYMDVSPGGHLRLTAMPKGGGSSNISTHMMLKPGVGLKGVKKFIIEAVAKAGSLGCPPYFIGIGIGGGEDTCMKLAKKALLHPFRVRNPDPRIAEMENDLLEKVNSLGIGAMGLGEGITALDLHIEWAARHPASLPVGIVFSCWALRHASATISAEGKVDFRD